MKRIHKPDEDVTEQQHYGTHEFHETHGTHESHKSHPPPVIVRWSYA